MKATPEQLKSVLEYNADTGRLTWKPRPASMFNGDTRIQKGWNAKYAGMPAFTAHRYGYLCGSVFGVVYQAHRVIWAIVYGKWPSAEIDHINHVRSDNRIVNLRDVGRLENAKNIGGNSKNTTGVTGVYYVKRRNKWLAKIVKNVVAVYEGYFLKKEDAILARKKAETDNGYHENHGAI